VKFSPPNAGEAATLAQTTIGKTIRTSMGSRTGHGGWAYRRLAVAC
jgi:hypothetical protein